jgi:hypothetical protein
MREKEREKQRDELFDEIKPMTLPKQEWRRKEAPQHSTTELAVDSQTIAPGGQTAANSLPGDDTAPSGSQTARAQEAHDSTEDEAGPTAAPSSLRTEAGGQTVGPAV